MTAVRLTYKSTPDPDTGETRLAAIAAPLDDPDHIAAFGDLKLVKAWLDRNGYRWVTGSQGIFAR